MVCDFEMVRDSMGEVDMMKKTPSSWKKFKEKSKGLGDFHTSTHVDLAEGKE